MKPGLKTTELWLTVAANVLIDSGALGVPDKYKAWTTAATTIGYAISRGLAKLQAAHPATIAQLVASLLGRTQPVAQTPTTPPTQPTPIK